MDNEDFLKGDSNDLFKDTVEWILKDSIQERNFQCGYCGRLVNSSKGIAAIINNGPNRSISNLLGVYICPNCKRPTFIDRIFDVTQVPLPKRNTNLQNIPLEVMKVYQEALDAYSVGAFTGTTLLCRKLLMHIAVDLGAKENESFAEYVKFFDEQHFISPRSHGWVDEIRKIGNKANHKLDMNTKEEAEKDLIFCEMILKSNYEYPNEISNEKDSNQ